LSGRLRNIDLSIYFFIKDLSIGNNRVLGNVATIKDGYPYNEIEQDTLVIPSVAVEHSNTSDTDAGELGASWYRRAWELNIFASSDTQRDDFGELIFDALDNSIPIKDFSGGYKLETGKKLNGADLRIIEYAMVENRILRPTYAFTSNQKIKYWRASINFDTLTTKAS